MTKFIIPLQALNVNTFRDIFLVFPLLLFTLRDII
nr:MAG TPA: hypothetical protein [Caudoviricetes sp.]